MNLFGAFIDKEELVKGVMWSSFNPISNTITVHVISVDKAYHGKGILNEADGILNKFKKKLGADKIIARRKQIHRLIKLGKLPDKRNR